MLPWLFWPYSRWFTGLCRFFTSQCQRLCLFGEINCYFYIDAEAEPTLQESLIALEFFTTIPLIQGLDFIFMCEFCCAVSGGLLPWPLLTALSSDFVPSGLDFLLLQHLLQPDKLTAPIVNLFRGMEKSTCRWAKILWQTSGALPRWLGKPIL